MQQYWLQFRASVSILTLMYIVVHYASLDVSILPVQQPPHIIGLYVVKSDNCEVLYATVEELLQYSWNLIFKGLKAEMHCTLSLVQNHQPLLEGAVY